MVPCVLWWQSSQWSSPALQLSTPLTFPQLIHWTPAPIPFPSDPGPRQPAPVLTVYCRTFHISAVLASLSGQVCRTPFVSAPSPATAGGSWPACWELAEDITTVAPWHWPAQSRTCSQPLPESSSQSHPESHKKKGLKYIAKLFGFRLITKLNTTLAYHTCNITLAHCHSHHMCNCFDLQLDLSPFLIV